MFLPPKTALVIGFEDTYDISLLANSLTDNGISSTLIIPNDSDIYEYLVEVDVIKLNFTIDKTSTIEAKALKACESLISDEKILKLIGEIQPTFVIFSALRHDACLLPWTKFIGSTPVIWSLGIEEEHYAIEKTKFGIPISTDGIYDRFWNNVNYKTIIGRSKNNYITPTINLMKKYIKNYDYDNIDDLYLNIELLFWGGDSILRNNFAKLTNRFIETGCHHCRGPKPLPDNLQKNLIEFRLGTIVVLLDDTYAELIKGISRQLPQGRQGQAVIWKTKLTKFPTDKPDNLFLHSNVDRQDIIGYSRTRILIAHCKDTEFLEAIYHGTPIICVPKNSYESLNEKRAVKLGMSISLNNEHNVEKIIDTITNINDNQNYRESGRSASQLIRDTPIPSTDKLIFWLDYIARNDKNIIKLSTIYNNNNIKTFAEDVQLYIGIIIGTLFGMLFATTSALSWYLQKTTNKPIKMKLKRHNK